MFKSSRDIESQHTNNANNFNNNSNGDRYDDMLSRDVYENDAEPVDIEDFSDSNNNGNNSNSNNESFGKSTIQRKQTDDTFFSNGNKNNFNGDAHPSTSHTQSESAENEGIGSKVRLHAKLLRKREHGAKVTNIELFFDLVFVYASKGHDGSNHCVVLCFPYLFHTGD